MSALLAHASCLSCFLIRRVYWKRAFIWMQRLLLASYRGFHLGSFLAAFGLFLILSFPLFYATLFTHSPSFCCSYWADVLGASRSKSSPLTFLCQRFHGNKGRRCLKPAFLLLWQEHGVPGVPGAFQAGTRDLQRFLPVLLPDG